MWDARGKSTHDGKNGTIGGYLLCDLRSVCVIPDLLQNESGFIVISAPGILDTSAAQVLDVSGNEDASPCGIVMAPWWEVGIGEFLLAADHALGQWCRVLNFDKGLLPDQHHKPQP